MANNFESIRVALLFVQNGENATLSYQHGWPRAFVSSPRYSCTPINLAGLSPVDHIAVARRLLAGRFDAIVLLHSVFSNQQNLRGFLFWTLAACRVPKVYFIGNEYKLMPEKVRFCKRLGISLLITQSNDERVHGMYRSALGCAVSCVPNTGIDASIFRPVNPVEQREIDIGYRAYTSTWYLGNDEKKAIADYFTEYAYRNCLKVDISLLPKDRFDAPGYAAFLNRCRGQIGTEAGGDYFELTDATRNAVNNYMADHPDADWPRIKRKFFDEYESAVPMRIISGRQVEAAACKTVQILYEGRYNNYFQPDEHYIALAKDHSNIEEVMEKFGDRAFCGRLTENAYDIALSNLTYEHLLASFTAALRQVL